jgi:hypothetical protein
MKKQLLFLFFFQGFLQADFSLYPVASPKFIMYNALLFKFNKFIYHDYSVGWKQIYPFEMMMFALWYNSPNHIFLEIIQEGKILGFACCQFVTNSHLYVRQFVLDPDIYDVALLESVLLRLFAVIPGITKLSVQCPAVFLEVKAMLLAFGFYLTEQDIQSVTGIFERYDWSAS